MSTYYRKAHESLVAYFIRYPILFSFSAYFIASISLTWPLLFKLDSTLFGDYGDSRGGIWDLWIKLNVMNDGTINHMVAAPFGEPAKSSYSQPIMEWLLKLVATLSNEVIAYNFVIITAFPLTATATYLFIHSLLKNRIAAFVGGLIFGFSPGAIMQAVGGHVAFSLNVFIPIYLLALFYNRTKRTISSAFYVACSFSLITLTALYFGYMAIYIGLFFLVFDLLSKKNETNISILMHYLLAALFSMLLILPFEYKAILQQFSWNSVLLTKAGQIRDLGELIAYSSRPWEFFIPSVDHPVLGKCFYDFLRTHLHGSNIYEQSLSLGMVPFGLLLVGIILTINNKLVPEYRIYFLFFVFGSLWMYFLSLPPLIAIGDIQVPTLSFFAYKIAPMFRVYARFGILVNFFVACSAAVVLTHLYQHMKTVRYFAMLAILLPVLVFEYWSIPPNYALSVSQPPNVYNWLAQQPGDIIIAEYPMMTSDEASFYTYLFWQRIHKKKLVNGAKRDNEEAWNFFEKIKDLDNPQTPAQLKSVGVKYVIIHSNMYLEGPVPNQIKHYYPNEYANLTYNGGQMPVVPFPLKLVKKFGSDFVFSLEESKNKVGQELLSLSVAGDS